MQASGKSERLNEFYERFGKAPRSSTSEEAYNSLVTILNTVEDELSGIAYDPMHGRNDGRLYPPQMDSIRDVPDKPFVKRFRSTWHNTFIGINGSVEICDILKGEVVFVKLGSDGRGVWDL
jgi:hypothetical protein